MWLFLSQASVSSLIYLLHVLDSQDNKGTTKWSVSLFACLLVCYGQHLIEALSHFISSLKLTRQHKSS